MVFTSQENSDDVGIIFLDPPFGIMDADWDIAPTSSGVIV